MLVSLPLVFFLHVMKGLSPMPRKAKCQNYITSFYKISLKQWPQPTTQNHPFHLTTHARTATESVGPVLASSSTFGPTGLSMVDNHTRLRGIADADFISV